MKFPKSAILPLAIGGFVSATPAVAVPLLFNFTGQSITGPVTASFQLDSNPIPDRINDQSTFGFGQIFFNNIPGIFNGNSGIAPTISFGTGLASQFQISGTSAGFAQFGGQTVFTGPFSNPVFSPGTFTFSGFSSGTLIVSAIAAGVPEPATWAMMLTGFGMVGFGMRRRRKRAVSVTYA